MWTQETPSQEGTYWFRRNKRQSPEQITIKDDKVVFLSGNIKALADVKGQWSDPIETRTEPQEGKSESFKRVYNWLLAHSGKVVSWLVSSLVVGLLIPFLVGYFSITSSKLVYAGKPPEYPKPPVIVKSKVENGLFVLHIKHKVPFRNYGVIPDHIGRVEIKMMGCFHSRKTLKCFTLKGRNWGGWIGKRLNLRS